MTQVAKTSTPAVTSAAVRTPGSFDLSTAVMNGGTGVNAASARRCSRVTANTVNDTVTQPVHPKCFRVERRAIGRPASHAGVTASSIASLRAVGLARTSIYLFIIAHASQGRGAGAFGSRHLQ